VFEVESKRRQIDGLMALDDRLYEGVGWHHDVAGGVDDLEIDNRVSLGEIQGGMLLGLDNFLRHDEMFLVFLEGTSAP